MTAFNAVRFQVKPGREQEFLDKHKQMAADWTGLKHVNIIKTGERSYCIIAEWSSMEALADARPRMIATLDTMRGLLEDLGGGLGLTDPVSGPVVLALKQSHFAMMSPDVYRQFRIDAPIHVQLRRDRIDARQSDHLTIKGRVWRIFRDDGHDLYWGKKLEFGVAMIDPQPHGPIAPGGTIYHSWDTLGRARWVEAFLSYWNSEFDLVHSQIAGIRGPTRRPVCDPAAEGFVCRGNL